MSELFLARANGRQMDAGDAINRVNKLAKEMAAERGADAVANATLGSLFDDAGRLWVMPTVWETLQSLDPVAHAEYSPQSGLPAFHDALRRALFRDGQPETYVEVAATVGGTGALHQAVQNYTSPGDVVLAPDWFWEPYANIARHIGRRFDTFPLFDDADRFDLAAMRAAIEGALATQDTVVVLLNSPANNPTGFSLTDAEWAAAIQTANDVSAPGKHVILVADVAYLDLAAPERRGFLRLLDGAGPHVLVLVAVSLSKGYTIYGLRSGALVCLTRDRAVADEFHTVMEFSNRVTWSNSPRAPQEMLVKIWGSDELTQRLLADQAHGQGLLAERSAAFVASAREHGVDICPYTDGFFGVIRDDDPWALCEALQPEGMFVVPVHGKGVRVAVSALNVDWCRRIPAAVAALRSR